ncbi:MAG: aminoglycoside phosphotransferase family protein [Roseiflexaceae bacterium]|nr:aminoglycoside phosphotransferase family protein [Roseiflexaceae bacterium]
MREPPIDLPEERILACLHTHYGLIVEHLEFLPLGHDSSAWVYRAQTRDGTSYFVKARLSLTNQPSLLVPRYLHDHGVTRVIAPLPTQANVLFATIEEAEYVLLVYPFIEGTTGMDHGMSDSQWIEYGAILRQIHTTAIAPELAQVLRFEQFDSTTSDLINTIDLHIGTHTFTEPSAQKLAHFWQEHRGQIKQLQERLQQLAAQVAQAGLPLVLCHADIHTNNVLLDTEQRLWIVDWDEVMLAPQERDLMFVIGGGISRALVGLHEEQLFVQGYGQIAMDSVALAYYRYAWAISDISAYAAQVLFRDDLGAETKRAGVTSFISLFQPGEIVDLAFTSNPTDRHG